MRASRKWIWSTLLMVAGGLLTTPATAQDIVLNEGSGDIFFLYESASSRWHTVFRAKGTAGQPTGTGATGLTNPFASFTGVSGTNTVIVPAVNGHTGDYQFDSLTVNFSTTETLSLGGNDFYYMTANGHFANPDGTPDLGIRIRLREDEVALGNPGGSTAADQFDNFTFTVNMSLSTFNGLPLQDTSAHVALMADSFGSPVALFNTADGDLTGTFNNIWTHQHRNWGFSAYGEYSLVLNLQGVGGEYGNSDHQAAINFHVIPEPSTMALMMLGLGLGGWLRKRRLQNLG